MEILGVNIFILSPIIILSIGSIALIMERLTYFVSIRLRSGHNFESSLKRIGRDSIKNVISSLAPDDKSPEKQLLDFALSSSLVRYPKLYKQNMDAVREKLYSKMERNLSILNGMGNVATLMGLLGTVSGMIVSFRRMNETGVSDPYILAAGISQALVTTAAGLLVAIPAVLAVHLFESIIDKHLEKMDLVIQECLAVAGMKYSYEKKTKRF